MCKIMSLCQVPNIYSVIYKQFFFLFINPYPKFTHPCPASNGLFTVYTICDTCLYFSSLSVAFPVIFMAAVDHVIVVTVM